MSEIDITDDVSVEIREETDSIIIIDRSGNDFSLKHLSKNEMQRLCNDDEVAETVLLGP